MDEIIMTDDIVILPPYVKPEHRPIIAEADRLLSAYNLVILDEIKKEVFGSDDGFSATVKRLPTVEKIMEAERMFHEDLYRRHLLKHLVETKLLYEIPQMMFKGVTSKG